MHNKNHSKSWKEIRRRRSAWKSTQNSDGERGERPGHKHQIFPDVEVAAWGCVLRPDHQAEKGALVQVLSEELPVRGGQGASATSFQETFKGGPGALDPVGREPVLVRELLRGVHDLVKLGSAVVARVRESWQARKDVATMLAL